MAQRVEADAPHLGGRVAEVACHVTVRRLVQRDGETTGKAEIARV
jgi:hypothetical protein